MDSRSERSPNKKATTSDQVLDSWEDDALSDSSGENEGQQEKQVKEESALTSNASPASSVPSFLAPQSSSTRSNAPSWTSQGASEVRDERRRPEKSTAVASRLIAGALGVRAPKKTEDQRAYERGIKEQEVRRRNREKEQREKERLEDEKAKESVWDG